MAEVTIYTSKLCGYCYAAKSLLHEKNVVFTEIDVTFNPAERAQMTKRAGRTSVPQVFINDAHVGGCDDLQSLEDQGKLDTLLAVEST